jgi:hypothetical protein
MEDLWMMELLEDKTDEWLDGYVFAQGNYAMYHFLIRDYDSEFNEDHGLVWVLREDVEREGEE